MSVLDEQNARRAPPGASNTGEVFGAINERRGALRELIVNSKRTFEATASRDEALAETFRDLPDLPRRVARRRWRGSRLLAQHAPAGERPEGPGRRPRADGARPRRPRSRPRAPVPRPRTADPREPHRRARPDANAAGGRAAHRRRCTRSSRSSTRSCRTSTSTSRRSPASSPTAEPTSRRTTAPGRGVKRRWASSRIGPSRPISTARTRPPGHVATRTSSRTRSVAL